MMKGCRPLALAAVFNVMVAVCAATAQTVIVRGAPPESTVEFVLNASTAGTATVDANGDAIVSATPAAKAGGGEMDAYIYVDACGTLRRVFVVERSMQPPPPDAGCERTQISGLFLVRRVSTIVVNVAGPNPTILLRHGRVSLRPAGPSPYWRPAPAGLVLFGGGGLAKFRDAELAACGDVPECSGGGFGGTYTAGVSFWMTRFFGAEASYLRRAEVAINGSGTDFRFNNSLNAHVLTIVGKAGVPAGPVRLYGQFGANYHRAKSGTTQTIDDRTSTVNGVTQTIRGGIQRFGIETGGWGWVFGGGMETWVTSTFAFYTEFGRAAIKGRSLDDADPTMDEGLTYLVAGARIRIF